MTATQKVRVIIVEDDRDVRESLAAVVSALGHDWVVFEAAEPVLTFDELTDSDVLLVDNNLPGMNGKDLLTTLRARGRDSPACLYSGKANSLLRDVAIELANTSLLEKGQDTNAITQYLMATLAAADDDAS